MTAKPFGDWTRDELDLPFFDLQCKDDFVPYDPLKHLISTGRLSGFCNRWGNLELFTTDGGNGFVDIAKNIHQTRSACYAKLKISDDVRSLIFSELDERDPVRYGIGYAQYSGRMTIGAHTFGFRQLIVAGSDRQSAFSVRFVFTNEGGSACEAEITLAGDCSLADRYHRDDCYFPELGQGRALLKLENGLGAFRLEGPADWAGVEVSNLAVGLSRTVTLAAGESMTVEVACGFGQEPLPAPDTESARRSWLAELSRVDAMAFPEDWMRDECLWDTSQFLAFECYNPATASFYPNLGGYGWRGFCIREIGENVLGLGFQHPDRAIDYALSKCRLQSPTGQVHKGCVLNREGLKLPVDPLVRPSDVDIWLALALTSLAHESKLKILDRTCAYRDGSEGSVWEHLVCCWRFIVNETGTGPHGLIRSLNGDWNDYLFPMGKGGRGESMMNTGMACRAGAQLAILARERSEDELAEEAETFVSQLREAAGAAFTGTHFVRGYTDAGKTVGGDDRVFINAQSWAALGACGTAEQRRTALLHALEHNATKLGLSLVNPPFPSPPPSDVSSLPIPGGEGENGGVWPQAVGWFIWSLADQGLTDEALELWKKNTLRNHYAVYPDTPFGIWNGPDCYNSHLAGSREAWTQVQLWDRRVHNPMNPSVAWQTFALNRILREA